MYVLEEAPSRSNVGRIGIVCPFCKNWVFGGKGIELDGEAKLEWHCIRCNAIFASNPPYENPGVSKDEFKEKIIQLLLQEGNCELVVKIFATSSKKPPEFIEEALRDLLSGV